MDEKIRQLKTTTFCGYRFTRKQLSEIQQTVASFPALSRHELGQTICEHMGWSGDKAKPKYQMCLSVLQQLEDLGVLQLPAKRPRRGGRRKPPLWTERSEPQAEIDTPLADLMPIQLKLVTNNDEIGEWNEWMDRYHYLGHKHQIGKSVRYFIVDHQQRKLGCISFGYAVKQLHCRDEWIGWQDQKHKKHLKLVVNNNRFLIFPWVTVKNLASKVLSMAVRLLPDDWQRLHGMRPVLIETFVDGERFRASSYRAANWHYLGTTKPQSGKTLKQVYAYPLSDDFRQQLLSGKSKPRKLSRRKSVQISKNLTEDDPLVQLWHQTMGIMTQLAAEFDQKWQQRRRVLNTLLVVLFIFRLVFSQNRQSYDTTLEELWWQCQRLDITLPQTTPVSAAAMCKARGKLDENFFKILQRRVVEQNWPLRHQHLWHGHQLYAVDGSKLKLPRELVRQGYVNASNPKAHYPQGMVSCLFRLKMRIPIDFELVSHGDESALARQHLSMLSADDVVIYDRGYYSYGLLHQHRRRGLHAIFRMRRNSGTLINRFMDSEQTDQIVTLEATRHIHRRWRPVDGEMPPQQLLRLVKYRYADTTFTLATTLLDARRYPISALSEGLSQQMGRGRIIQNF